MDEDHALIFSRIDSCDTPHTQDFEVDNIGGLMAVIVMNAGSSEEARGSLGILNWIGDRLLYLAHLQRPNTIAGEQSGTHMVLECASWC